MPTPACLVDLSPLLAPLTKLLKGSLNVMSNDDVSEIVEIRDSEIDAEAIMRQIRESIRKRRAHAEAQGIDYAAFVDGTYVSQEGRRFDADLYYELRRISISCDKLGVDLSLTEPRLPLIGPLVQRVRTALHYLVIYYVNILARQQVRVNEHMMRALTALVKNLEPGPTPTEVETLRQEVTLLRARLGQIEKHLERDRT